MLVNFLNIKPVFWSIFGCFPPADWHSSLFLIQRSAANCHQDAHLDIIRKPAPLCCGLGKKPWSPPPLTFIRLHLWGPTHRQALPQKKTIPPPPYSIYHHPVATRLCLLIRCRRWESGAKRQNVDSNREKGMELQLCNQGGWECSSD